MYKLLLVIVFSLCLVGCWEDEKKSANLTEEGIEKEAERGIYHLAPSEKVLAPQERAKAQAFVDFANRTEHLLHHEACGKIPDVIMQETEEYSSSFTVKSLSDFFPSDAFPADDCAVKNALPPESLADEAIRNELKEILIELDQWRVSMQESYSYLREYVADKKMTDGGERGENLCLAIKGAYVPFELARKKFFTWLSTQADAAQAGLLQGHPLRMQVLYAKRIVGNIHALAALLGPVDADPDKMNACLLSLEKELEIAENLPFPLAGAVEMEYRGFLKKARQIHACFAKGVIESFNEGIRKAINESWQDCMTQYNRFVDALAVR